MLQNFRGVFFEKNKSLRQAHRPRGGWRDPKIDKNRYMLQDTCSKLPGAFFSRKKSPWGRHVDHEVVAGTLKP